MTDPSARSVKVYHSRLKAPDFFAATAYVDENGDLIIQVPIGDQVLAKQALGMLPSVKE